MAVETYAGSTLGKMGLAVLGKTCAVSATTFALTLGTAVVAVVARGYAGCSNDNF